MGLDRRFRKKIRVRLNMEFDLGIQNLKSEKAFQILLPEKGDKDKKSEVQH